ncbi:MAG: flagellar basal body-associated FliL family protein [Verrucomicrobia bacterium]|nr:flagellar basal body-associated FliL family protein [Verrucomicrobiota bacterium]
MAEPKPNATGSPTDGGHPKGGLRAYLPLIVIVILAPAVAWLTYRFIPFGAKGHSAPAAAEEEPAEPVPTHRERPKAKPIVEGPKAGDVIIAPLTRDPTGFHPKKFLGKLVIMDVNGDALGEARPDIIRVNIRGGNRAYLVIASLTVRGLFPELIEAVNVNRYRLLETAETTLARKTLADFETSGVQMSIASELLSEFNAVLGARVIDHVDFVQFDVRPK